MSESSGEYRVGGVERSGRVYGVKRKGTAYDKAGPGRVDVGEGGGELVTGVAEPHWVLLAEAAQVVGVTTETIRRWMVLGAIEGRKLGVKRWQVDLTQVTARLQSGAIAQTIKGRSVLPVATCPHCGKPLSE